ncbi:MAG: 2-oxoacid:acceptor oxidoreductase subunit alpha, partial [Desulfobacterales bacterium]|nr:2-oxoacid:acceptor oxidoreductase subunit alpha [Desulfobacterales bacterium]
MSSRWIKTPFLKGLHYLSGNEAATEGAIAAGCRFYAGYPITPSSELMERISVRLRDVGGVFIQMEDEIASISAVIGASWAGAKAMTATSGPGFSLMQESIGYAAFTETPCVVIDVQRAGPCTGQATRVGSGDIMQAKWGSHGDYQVIALSPWSVQEMYDLTLRAFNLSERYRVPTMVMADEAVGHLRETINIPEKVEVWNRKKKRGASPFGTEEEDGVPPMPAFGEGEKLSVTGSTHDAFGFRKTDDPKAHAALVERINQKI